MKQYRNRDGALNGADVVIVGLFSAKDREYEARLDELADLVEARGGRVVGRFVQRRGASDRWNERPGGAARMSQPFSRRTLLTHGKVHEIAEACTKDKVYAAVFLNALTNVQRAVLANMLGCLVFSGEDLAAYDGTVSRDDEPYKNTGRKESNGPGMDPDSSAFVVAQQEGGTDAPGLYRDTVAA
ncbi:hypothetical protein [Catelliglobosispora koreensis]|uniref:hypothetical protein n=1 Tax=Catelliglobosispora koreensis TaxID=129052 RepID=UPI0003A319FB|nr:hypothetical protein [Catelliglobosispora koreensis]